MLIPKNFPVTCHTKHVGLGTTFFAIDGFEKSGMTFIAQAIAKGAKKIVVGSHAKKMLTEEFLASTGVFDSHAKKNNVEYCFVDDTRKALAQESARALNYPAKKLKIIGITGTKGKTTTTFLIEHILSSAGYKTALLGSIKNKIGNREALSELTTPESDYIHMFFHECVNENVDYVVMEVSSHSIALQRIFGISFDHVGFTNLAPEHLDFHNTMEEYFEIKSQLFSQVKSSGSLVINCDDEWGEKLLLRFAAQHDVVSFGQKKSNKMIFSVEKNTDASRGIKITSKRFGVLKNSSMFGVFNGYNITMAALICHEVGVESEIIKSGLEGFLGVPGRMQMHRLQNYACAFVDYAHNPSSVEAALQALRPQTDHLIVVFGCGGDRDKTKRPVMGKLAATYGDTVIITDDNPRTEDRDKIIQEICAGICEEKRKSTLCIADRSDAIKKAAELSKKNSIIALLGKGHESYYMCQGKKYYFNDYEEIKKY